LIVAEDVVSDEADNDLLVPMIEEVEENLGGNADETAADGGYYSPKQLLEADEKGYDILVNINKSIAPADNGNEFHKSKFVYDSKADVFICPSGKELRFAGMQRDKRKRYPERKYQCESFVGCPSRKDCCKGKSGRKITMGPHYQAVIRQLEKQEIPEKKKQLRRRKAIVEPAFGIIKEIMGFRRFTYRGLENVRAQWSLICTAFNLRKLFKVWTEGKLAFVW
jgi:hypothetical protein